MDKILTIFDPLPPLDGQIRTFLALFSYVQMEIVDICQPPPPLILSTWLLNDPKWWQKLSQDNIFDCTRTLGLNKSAILTGMGLGFQIDGVTNLFYAKIPKRAQALPFHQTPPLNKSLPHHNYAN